MVVWGWSNTLMNNPKHLKAFSMALSCQNRYDIAVEAYKKAIELDPSTEIYKTKLALAEAEDKKKQAQKAAGSNPPPPVTTIILEFNNHTHTQ